MPIPAGYTQLTTGFWRKDSDLSGPYAWTGAAFYLISTGVAGSGVPADYTQHPSGFWFKTADGSGPYSYDGTNFWLAGNGGPSGAITVATVNVSSAINMANGSTFNLYNTADQTTNYERLRADWSGNIARVWTGAGGSGTERELRIGAELSAGAGAPGWYARFRSSATPFISFGNGASSNGNTGPLIELGSISLSASAIVQTLVGISPAINQSGTAGYIALDINPTETATGSGTKLLQRWAVGGSAVAQMTNGGNLALSNVIAVNQIGFSSGLGVSIDVSLNRDAADTLALRRSANAQTLRVYNTYTDGSNYERGNIGWVGNVFYVGTSAAGTGTQRATSVFGNSVTIQSGTGPTSRWTVNASGHFLAEADNTYDIGASGANRPRNAYIGNDLIVSRYTALLTAASTTTVLAIGPSTTNRSQINFVGGVAPSSPNNGDMWYDGTDLKFRTGGVTKTFTLT